MSLQQKTRVIINTVREKTGRVVLFYSGGKDSIALLHLLAESFDEVICVFMYFVKDLRHIDTFLNDALIRYPNVKLEQIPHWLLSHLIRGGIYCPAKEVRAITLKDIDENIRLKYGVNYTFYGMKKSDSLNRRLMLNTYEPSLISNTNKVYPLADWTNGDVLRYIKNNRLPKPIQYSKLSSNGVVFDVNVLLYLRGHYPDDLKRIYSVFPLSERILFEYDYARSSVNKVSDQ